MKTTMMAILAAGALTLTCGALRAAEMTQTDDQMGLSKTSVYDNPSPDVFAYPVTKPADASALPRAYIGAPPQVPHNIDTYLPITSSKNKCLGCHDDTDMIGKARGKGTPTPMPESHYHKADNGSLTFSDKRYVCVQCHTPQADVNELVGNTFKQ
jgi:nitrate reductase (cytochrome), electron transfer subunit